MQEFYDIFSCFTNALLVCGAPRNQAYEEVRGGLVRGQRIGFFAHHDGNGQTFPLLHWPGWSGVALASVGDVDGVVQEREDGREAFFSAALAAGEIDDKGGAAQAGDAAREPG
jgi:hypothetical protein